MTDTANTAPIPKTTPVFAPLKLDALDWHDEHEIPAGIPILDYERLVRGEHAGELRELLAKGSTFYIRNFGISEQESQSVFNETRQFFNQPYETKAKMVHPERAMILRGYSAYGTGAYENSLDNGKAFNQYDKFAWGPVDNVAPSPAFEQAYQAMFAKLNGVARGTLDSILDALGLTDHPQRENLYDGDDTVLHCQCYYPEKPRGEGRMIAHADASTVTLLNQLPAKNRHVGLQVKIGDEYVGVPAIRGTLIVLVGESLNGISGGRAKPCVHAVIGPATDIENSERSSMPFFANPRSAFEMPRPADTTHHKFYNDSGLTTFGEYANNIAHAYQAAESRESPVGS